jgi:two-component system, OmpR family, sensor kinase
MLDSVRARLTLWYTSLLAIFLVGLSVTTYFIFWRSTLERTDTNLTELAQAFLTTVHAEMQDNFGPDAPRIAVQEAMIEHRFRDHIFVILDPSSKVFTTSEDAAANPSKHDLSTELLDSSAFRNIVADSGREDHLFASLKGRHGGYRAFARKFSLSGQTYTLVIVQSLHSQKEMLSEVRSTFAWIIPIAIVLASGGGYFLARKSLAPVVAMSDRADHISAANLHERLPVQNKSDELGRLAASFNQMLERVDQSFERQRRFMADASHELRTPAAILRGESEVALSRPDRSLEEYRESLTVLRDEAQRLTQIVEDLFTLTRADAGQYPLSRRDFYLDELVADCVHATRTLALAKNISVNADMSEELPIRADEALLRRMILNLLDNAIKYTPRDGQVTISAHRSDDEYSISVTDTGTGIPEDVQTRVFERFFRVDKARTRSDNDGGAGLGLAIARWIADAHRGRLILARSDSKGSTFTAFLPVNVPVFSSASPETR